MEFFHYRDFDRSVTSLRKAGGESKRKADKVLAILGSLHLGPDVLKDLPTSKQGESRIKSCVKYDLGGGYRLVTVQTENAIAFCYAGSHEQTGRWLEKNSGLTFSRGSSGVWEAIYKSPSINEPIRREPVPSSESLLQRMEPARVQRLLEGVPVAVVLQLATLGTLVTPGEIEACCASIAPVERRTLVYDVLSLLASGNDQAAIRRLDLELGEAMAVEDMSPEEMLEVKDGDEIRRIRVGSAEHEQWLRHFARCADFFEWLLFLHPEQSAVANAEFSGAAQLSGVSGSGKTCVAIHRAVRLAFTNPTSKVLLVTLNRSLAGLIEKLVAAASPDEGTRNAIRVTSFFQLCQEFLNQLEPQNRRLYSDVTWKLNEHIDEVFREYYRCWLNNSGAECLLPIHQSLIAQGLCAETYVREEFDWIRSAFIATERHHYLNIERAGRRVPMQEEFRGRLLDGLREWEAKMRDVGVVDYLGLTTALSRHIDALDSCYDHIIVDEAQDFGTSELKILRRLCAEGPNDIFLCGDIAQHVLPKHRSLVDAGINTAGRTRRIVRNYRNSREILKAAYEVLIHNLDEGMLDSSDLEILDPQYASRSSNEPVVLEAGNLGEEIGYARTLASDHLAANPDHRCCIAFAGYSSREVEIFATSIGLPTLRGERDPLHEGLVVSDLEQMKGYEFNLVAIVNCRKGSLPPEGTPAEESFRHGCRLYVAMTRARDELYLSYSGECTPWLNPESRNLSFLRWDEVIAINRDLACGAPERLREQENDSTRQVLALCGRDFLYTPEARGLSVEAIRKIDELVDGIGLIRDGVRVRWRDMGTLLADIETQPRVRTFWGPVLHREVWERLRKQRTAAL